MRVSELMHSPALTCRPETTIAGVARMMEQHNVGCIVVVDRIGYVAGVVTDRDIAIRGVAHGHSGDIPIEDVMTRDVAWIDPTADSEDAASLMLKRGIRRLPVVDRDGGLHGLVALDDLVRNLGHETDALADTLLDQASRRWRH